MRFAPLVSRLAILVFGRDDRNIRPVVAFTLEVYRTVNQGEQRMILAHTHVRIRVVFRTSLTDDDITGRGRLTAEYLYTQTFAF